MQTSIAKWLTKPTSVIQRPEAVSTDGTPTVAATQAPSVHVQPANAPIRASTASSTRMQVTQPSASVSGFGRAPSRLLPPQATLTHITADLLPSFRRLNSLLLQIPYQDKFFAETVSDEVIASISRAALWTYDGDKPRLIGGIRCRLLAPSNASTGPRLYISTIGVLAPYRSYGLATHLLEEVLRVGVEMYGVGSVCAHVWVANEEGLKWYAKRGFKEVGREDGYYRRLDPQAAVLIRRDVGIMDMLPQAIQKR